MGEPTPITSVSGHVRPAIPAASTHQAVGSIFNLSVDAATLLLGVGDGGVDQPGIPSLACGSKDKRWVGGSVLHDDVRFISEQRLEERNSAHLRLVSIDGWKRQRKVVRIGG